MASKRKRIIEDDIAQELILESDSDIHIPRDEILSHESDSEKEKTAMHSGQGIQSHLMHL